MCWKKNGFSYLIWFIYLFTVTLGLFCLANVFCGILNVPAYWGTAVGFLWLSMAAAAVCWLHMLRKAGNRDAGFETTKAGDQSGRRTSLIIEISLAVILLAVGLILRINSLDTVYQGTAYFDAASVISGQSIPETAHGAEYLYLWLLRGIFYFLGNKIVFAVFFQILLQLSAVTLLYLTMRRCAGKIGGMVFLSLCVFSGYLRTEALALSPGMLYLVIWAAVLLWIVSGNRETISLPEWFVKGLFSGIICCLDISGVILLPVAAAVVFCRRNGEIVPGRKAAALLLYALGVLAGFGASLGAGPVLNGGNFSEALLGWTRLYGPSGFPVFNGPWEGRFLAEYLVLVVLMSFGIFGFWRDRENTGLQGWIPALVTVVLLSAFGCDTAELPVFLFLYLAACILAGSSVRECLRPVMRAGLPDGAKGNEETDIENEIEMPESEGRDMKETETERLETGSAEIRKPEAEEAPATDEVQFIENPLPLPKKHVGRRLDYDIQSEDSADDYDLAVDDNDDFDI